MYQQSSQTLEKMPTDRHHQPMVENRSRFFFVREEGDGVLSVGAEVSDAIDAERAAGTTLSAVSMLTVRSVAVLILSPFIDEAEVGGAHINAQPASPLASYAEWLPVSLRCWSSK